MGLFPFYLNSVRWYGGCQSKLTWSLLLPACIIVGMQANKNKKLHFFFLIYKQETQKHRGAVPPLGKDSWQESSK